MKFYRLTSQMDRDEIVKDDNGKRYTYCYGSEKWVSSGIMISYMWPEDDNYDQYIEISEEEAAKIMDKQRKKYNELLVLAIQVAVKAHKGQVDKGGNPYFLHPMAVADSLDDTECKIVGYLHDVCEDSKVTPKALKKWGLPIEL